MKNMSKKIWITNGILFFFLLIFVLFRVSQTIYLEYFATYDSGGVIVGEKRADAQNEGVQLQTITYSNPQRLYNSDYKLLSIGQTDYKIPRKVLEEAKTANDFSYGVPINVIIFNDKTGEYRLLLEQPACVKTLDAPFWKVDSLQTYILYEIAFTDNNKDGKINRKDSGSLFISDLSGNNFSEILPDSLKLVSFDQTRDHKRIEFQCLRYPADRNSPEEYWEPVSCSYNIATRTLKVDKKLNALLQEAKEILVK